MDIVVVKSLDEINQKALKELIESKDGMDRNLVIGYYQKKEFVEFDLAMLNAGMLSKGPYVGAMVATNPWDSYPVDIVWVDKVVVLKPYRGNGVFNRLWEKMVKNHPRLGLRASKTNPANELYKERAELHDKDKKWNIYHLGLSGNEVGQIVAYGSNLPESLLPKRATIERDEENRIINVEPKIEIHSRMPQVPLEQRASVPLF